MVWKENGIESSAPLRTDTSVPGLNGAYPGTQKENQSHPQNQNPAPSTGGMFVPPPINPANPNQLGGPVITYPGLVPSSSSNTNSDPSVPNPAPTAAVTRYTHTTPQYTNPYQYGYDYNTYNRWGGQPGYGNAYASSSTHPYSPAPPQQPHNPQPDSNSASSHASSAFQVGPTASSHAPHTNNNQPPSSMPAPYYTPYPTSNPNAASLSNPTQNLSQTHQPGPYNGYYSPTNGRYGYGYAAWSQPAYQHNTYPPAQSQGQPGYQYCSQPQEGYNHPSAYPAAPPRLGVQQRSTAVVNGAGAG